MRTVSIRPDSYALGYPRRSRGLRSSAYVPAGIVACRPMRGDEEARDLCQAVTLSGRSACGTPLCDLSQDPFNEQSSLCRGSGTLRRSDA
jgi:hypothetical protein